MPEGSGLLDQPAGLLQRAAYLSDVYAAHRAYRDALLSHKGEALNDWETRNEDVMKILAAIRELKRQHGG